jgi:hypothetical protein
MAGPLTLQAAESEAAAAGGQVLERVGHPAGLNHRDSTMIRCGGSPRGLGAAVAADRLILAARAAFQPVCGDAAGTRPSTIASARWRPRRALARPLPSASV